MKKLLLSLGFAFMFISYNYAQSTAAGLSADKKEAVMERKAHENTDKLATKLNLNESQKAKAYPLVLEFVKAKEEFTALKESNKAAYREKMETIVKGIVAKIDAHLTKEQQDKFHQLLEERRQKSDKAN